MTKLFCFHFFVSKTFQLGFLSIEKSVFLQFLMLANSGHLPKLKRNFLQTFSSPDTCFDLSTKKEQFMIDLTILFCTTQTN